MSYQNVSLLLPMNGANNGTEFTDWSPVPKTVTRSGATLPTTVTAQSKFYGSSGLFPAVTGTQQQNHLRYTLPSAIGTQPFTIRGWQRVGNATDSYALIDTRYADSDYLITNSDAGFLFYLRGASSSLSFLYGAATTRIDSTTAFSADTWHHTEVTRDNSNNLRLFLDGNLEATQAGVTNNFSNLFTAIGGFVAALTRGAQYVQDFELIIGEALHTANFTPPTRLLGTISNAAVGATKIVDKEGNPAARKVFAVPRNYLGDNAGAARIWHGESNASGEFEIQAPADVDHSVVALADEADLRNDLVARVIPV